MQSLLCFDTTVLVRRETSTLVAFAFIEAGAGTEMVTGSVHHGACWPSSALQWPRLCAAAYERACRAAQACAARTATCSRGRSATMCRRTTPPP